MIGHLVETSIAAVAGPAVAQTAIRQREDSKAAAVSLDICWADVPRKQTEDAGMSGWPRCCHQ